MRRECVAYLTGIRSEPLNRISTGLDSFGMSNSDL